MVTFIGVSDLANLVGQVGLETFLRGLAARLEADFIRWDEFDKSARYAAHVPNGVIELMPAADSEYFTFKQVNGHPGNTSAGMQTVAALGVLTRVDTGYPVLLSEMTLLTAMRTAAMSALAATYLARPSSRVMAIIGQGAQSEFQAIAFKALLGIERVQCWDKDQQASQKFADNLADSGIEVVICSSADEAVIGADVITTVTADKVNANILSDNMVGSGLHINAVGGDCPGKTELAPEILTRAQVFVEYTPQTRIEGEIQQMPDNFEVTELSSVFAGVAPGRTSDKDLTIFDSVGFGIEDFSALTYLYDLIANRSEGRELDLIAEPSDPRDLFGILDKIPVEA